MKNLMICLLIFIFLSTIYKCTYKKENIQPKNTCLPQNRKLSFKKDIDSIFSMTCAIPDCHNSNQYPPGNYTTYNGIKQKLEPGKLSESKIWQRIKRGEMPPSNTKGPNLSECNKEKIKIWIKNGAKNN